MADLTILSPTLGQTPTLSSHVATKGYVDSARPLSSSTRTASYTFVAADAGVEQVYNSASAGTFTLPTNATQAIAIGLVIPLRQIGLGQLTIAPAAGVTLVSRGSAFRLNGQYAVAEVRKTGTDAWILYGDIIS